MEARQAGVSDRLEELRWRTPARPLRLRLDVDAIFKEVELVDWYEDGVSRLDHDLALATEEFFATVATNTEIARVEALRDEMTAHRVSNPYTQEQLERHASSGHQWRTDEELKRESVYRALAAALHVVYRDVEVRAIAQRLPAYFALAAAKSALDEVDRLWDADRHDYRAAYVTSVRSEITARGGTVSFVLLDPSAPDPTGEDPLADRLHRRALETTPMPLTGQPPYWEHGRLVLDYGTLVNDYRQRARELWHVAQ